MRRSGGTILRWCGYGVASVSLVAWYVLSSNSAETVGALELGLFYLQVFIFLLFLSDCFFGGGFTLWRVILLIVPFGLTTLMQMKQFFPVWPDEPAAALQLLRSLAKAAFLQLTIMLAWVAVFPLPFPSPKIPLERAKYWRRWEWFIASLLAVSLFYTAVLMSAAIERAAPLETVVPVVRKIVGNSIQQRVILIFLFAFFRVAVRRELKEKYVNA